MRRAGTAVPVPIPPTTCDNLGVLVPAGDHVYRMDYGPMIAFHQQHNADVTLGAVVVPMEEGQRFGILETDAEGRVISFMEKPDKPRGTLGSMGIYVFGRDTLTRVLIKDAQPTESGGQPTQHDFGRNIIPSMMARGERVFAYPFTGYWVLGQFVWDGIASSEIRDTGRAHPHLLIVPLPDQDFEGLPMRQQLTMGMASPKITNCVTKMCS